MTSKDTFILDTQVVLWMGIKPSALSSKVKKLFKNDKHSYHVSIASIWEISIKRSLGKLQLPVSTKVYLDSVCLANGIEILNIDLDHALGVEQIERIHGDPFDRLLVSQARHSGFKIISSDQIFDSYKIPRIW